MMLMKKMTIRIFLVLSIYTTGYLFAETPLPVADDTTTRVSLSKDIDSVNTDTIPGNVIYKSNGLIDDTPIVSMLDSLAHITYFRDYYLNTDTAALNIYGFSPDEVPVYPDSVYAMRLAALNSHTPLDIEYNDDVKRFIHLYSVDRRSLTSRMLGLAEIYFPLFEEQLDRYGLPLELKYLAIVESALNPTAGSRAGAKGIWQFMYGTGKAYGLNVTSYVDERFDTYKATVAACQHMKDLYQMYEDWFLVMAAYNAGAGNVNKAMRRAGHIKNYWAIQPFLPRETRGYVPAFIAVYYVMNHAAEHNLYPIHPGILYDGIDTVMVQDVLSFDQISEMLEVPIEDIEFLNPAYKEGVFPAIEGEKHVLRLPKEYIGDFINNEDTLYRYRTKKGIEREKLLAEVKRARERKFHIVRSGENLGLIAQRYRCNVSDLKRWNGLRGTVIYPGQRLVVFAPSSIAYAQSNYTPTGNETVHRVQRGETLGLIASRYNCTVTDLKYWNNLRSSTIYPDQNLYVKNPQTASSQSQSIPQSEEKDGYILHTIQPGETLWDIARFYDGVTVSQIKSLNNIINVRKLKPGQQIKISKTG